jgi:endo-1,4-beta-mannosidase
MSNFEAEPNLQGSEPFALGVNYWPRRKAMYWWSRFEAAEVRDEFALIGELGLRFVRIFLLWDDFQPEPDRVSEACLDALETVCDIAAECGLGLNVTFFTGHMSGPNWAPRWLLADKPAPGARQLVSQGRVVESGYENPFSHPLALDAAELQVRSVARRLRGHRAVAIYNLGNEPDLFARPPSSEIGRAWVSRMRNAIAEIDSATPVTIGLHIASLQSDNGLRVDQAFGETDFGVMHVYPMYTGWARQPLDEDVVAYCCAVTQALAKKPILMEECGGCTAPSGPSTTWEWTAYGKPRTQFMAAEQDFAEYTERLLERLWEQGALGAYLWCFADYATPLWDCPPCAESRHERHFGLVRPDGTQKPHAGVLKRFARQSRRVQPVPRGFELGLSADEYYADAEKHLIEGYSRYLRTGP